MSTIQVTDPLSLISIEAGLVGNPSTQEGAEGTSELDVDQRSVKIGEPVPIVFARRVNEAGGILISPGATEARFENDAADNVTAWYHLVLSEGQIDPIPVSDVLQRACRVGTFTQTYNRRAGTWEPGNFITQWNPNIAKPEASYICGSIGLYPNMSTLSFQVTIDAGFEYWRRQVHVFIRGGMWVTRLMDDVVGPSNNFADLVRWMLLNSGRVPAALIDTTALSDTARFLEVNNFTCNCWLQEAENYGDFIAKWAPYFLIGESNAGGKKGLRPLLPVNADGTIKTTAITPEYVFTEDEILPGTFEVEYANWADRQPFVAQMSWRQELGYEAAIIRTAEVRFINEAESGPYESHDMSGFCTNEAHAVKAGAYIIARRKYVIHTIRFSARPQAHNRLLVPGSIIRVLLQRTASGGGPSVHDYIYQVERITKTLAGDVGYECSHFPVDDQSRSIVAQIVTTATGGGVLFDTNTTGVGCDVNSSSDETIPEEEFTELDPEVFNPEDFETVIDDIGFSDGGSGSSGGGVTPDNPSDFKDATPLGPIQSPVAGQPVPIPDDICAGGTVIRVAGNIGDEANAIEEEVDAETGWVIPALPPNELGGSDWNGKFVQFRLVCPNGEEQATEPATNIGALNAANTVFNYYGYSAFSVTITATASAPLLQELCSDNSVVSNDPGNISPYTFTATGNAFFAVTTAGTPTNSPTNWLASAGGPGAGSACGASGNYRRNGVIIIDSGSLFSHSYSAVDYWGGNINMLASTRYSGSHQTTITSIVLNQNVPGLGNAGDNITDLGLRDYVPYPPTS